MSLTPAEQVATRQELQANFALSGLSFAQIAQDLATTPQRVQAALKLNVRHIEDPWILRNYLNEQLQQAGKTPVAYSKLTGDPAGYWFLDAQRIQRGRLD